MRAELVLYEAGRGSEEEGEVPEGGLFGERSC